VKDKLLFGRGTLLVNNELYTQCYTVYNMLCMKIIYILCTYGRSRCRFILMSYMN